MYTRSFPHRTRKYSYLHFHTIKGHVSLENGLKLSKSCQWRSLSPHSYFNRESANTMQLRTVDSLFRSANQQRKWPNNVAVVAPSQSWKGGSYTCTSSILLYKNRLCTTLLVEVCTCTHVMKGQWPLMACKTCLCRPPTVLAIPITFHQWTISGNTSFPKDVCPAEMSSQLLELDCTCICKSRMGVCGVPPNKRHCRGCAVEVVEEWWCTLHVMTLPVECQPCRCDCASTDGSCNSIFSPTILTRVEK